MITRKQIRVYVDVDQWTALKSDDDAPETDTATLKRLLTELEQLRDVIGQLAGQDISQLSTVVETLSEVHSNPLIALGICLERYRQTEREPMLQSSNGKPQPSQDTSNDFIDNSGEF